MACAIPTPTCIANAVAGSVAGTVLHPISDAVATAFGKVLALSLTFWTKVDTPTLSGTTGPVGSLRGQLAWLVAALTVASLLIAAARLALTRRSDPAIDAARGIVTLLLVSALAVPGIGAMAVAGDHISASLLSGSTGADLGSRLAQMVTGLGGLGVILALIVGGLGIAASLGQIALMLVRDGVMILLLGLLPLIASGAASGRSGRAALGKATAWLVAFTVYKPLASAIYALVFWTIGKGSGPVQVLSGVTLMGLAIVALPALLGLAAFHAAPALSHGGSGGAAAAAAIVVATGARTVGGGAGPTQQPAYIPGRHSAPSGASAAPGAAAAAPAAAPIVSALATGAAAAQRAARATTTDKSSSEGNAA